ncbi:lysosome-associated membrane glycoprotein 1-like [Mercenaria mercenaria]|uniref:lysosome-associated membrane glycoprotein 1-like n=1 Tax=Mercenaria mercenaria TaxID=6596 RepID=UPI00234E4349|nr:lysosome-associated membrane glycoprotein 1-like [Mercenaria mercenaria]XP_045199626.2 lysosome-associated membrane glycoprotein 1-like [Mercenaria mercenaria]
MKVIILILLCSYLFVCHVSATSSQPPRNNYTVSNDDVTCVIMTAGFELVVPYAGNATNYTTIIPVPSSPYVNGSCGVDRNTLNVYFNNSWTLTFTFTNSSKTEYQMDTILLTYAASNAWFPNISSAYAGKIYTFTTQLPDGTNQAPVSGSYQCQGQTNLALNGSIVINIYDIRYRAFGETNTTWFANSNIQQCTQTSPVPQSDTAAAVSVGIALAVMIVVVVLLYIVVTKVKGDKYEYT